MVMMKSVCDERVERCGTEATFKWNFVFAVWLWVGSGSLLIVLTGNLWIVWRGGERKGDTRQVTPRRRKESLTPTNSFGHWNDGLRSELNYIDGGEVWASLVVCGWREHETKLHRVRARTRTSLSMSLFRLIRENRVEYSWLSRGCT